MKLNNKKFVSALILSGLGFALAASWFYFYASQGVIDQETHSLLQEKAQAVLSDYIEESRPEIRHIVFHKVWTKNTSRPDRVKIFFSYTLSTEEKAIAGDFFIESEAYLTRQPNSQDWILSDFQAKNKFLEFSEPLLIKASRQQPE